MKSADLTVGTEYAVRVGTELDAARVVLRVGPARGNVVVRVLSSAGTRLRRGAEVTIGVRQIVSTWDDWMRDSEQREVKRAEAEWAAAQRESEWEWESRRTADPDRPLPRTYESVYLLRPHEWGTVLAASRTYVTPRVVEVASSLLSLVEHDLARDTVAATQALDSEVPSPGSDAAGRVVVRDAFERTAQVLRQGFWSNQYDTVHTGVALREHDVAFVTACIDASPSVVGEIRLPFVPRTGRPAVDAVSAIAWVRVAYGNSDGLKAHSPQCSILKSKAKPALEAETQPLWTLRLDPREKCTGCGGPGLPCTPELIAFRAASDFWLANGGPIEMWQFASLLHMIGLTHRQGAIMREPDRSRVALVVHALAEDTARHPHSQALDISRRWPISPTDQTALQVTIRRLRVVSDVLPEDVRPQVPFPLGNANDDGKVAGPIETILSAATDWLTSLTDVPGVDSPVIAAVLFDNP